MKFSSGINTIKLFLHNQDQKPSQLGMGKWKEMLDIPLFVADSQLLQSSPTSAQCTLINTCSRNETSVYIVFERINQGAQTKGPTECNVAQIADATNQTNKDTLTTT